MGGLCTGTTMSSRREEGEGETGARDAADDGEGAAGDDDATGSVAG